MSVRIKLPSGKVIEAELGKRIIDYLGRDVCCVARYNGKLVDLTAELKEPGKVEILGFDTEEGRYVFWHTSSHILAQAVKELFPNYLLGIGHPTENNFFYEFYTHGKPFTPEDLEAIEERMKEIVKRDLEIRREELPKEEAIKLFEERGERFKVELLREDIKEEVVSVYWQGDFVDLCRGPHLPRTGLVKYIKVLSASSTYWKGKEGNPTLQRIYAVSFPKKKMLDDYLKMLEEAKKRDHRVLGERLGIFKIFDEAGPGLVFWLPRGAIMRRILEDLIIRIHLKRSYQLVYTPHIARGYLYEISGHLKYYKENMFLMKVENELYAVKPMNCPMHILIYKSRKRSYRELPIRYFELGTVYRYERSGVLHGLLRVRGFTQDDAHIFTTPEKLQDEIVGVIDLVQDLMSRFGIEEFEAKLSVRDPKNKEKYMGSDEDWERAEEALARALELKGIEFKVEEGEAAFYGPKIDISMRDALGRKWQLSTIQLDFNLPRRFEATYVDKDNTEKPVIMIHRAILGSIERFMGILIEHYAGDFPVWIAPTQVIVIPVSDKFNDYALHVYSKLVEAGIRAEVDLRSETMGKKIRDAELMKIPYMLVVGAREQSSGTVSVRRRKKGNLGVMSLEEFMERVLDEIKGPLSV